MQKQLAAGIAAVGLLAGAPPMAQTPGETLQELETVLIIGEQPGPGLWKVSKGDHVLWVLASYQPLPKGMTWRSRQIEERIAESQEVLYAPNLKVRPNIGLMRGMTLNSAARKASKLPNGKTLKDVLSPVDYARWLVLRDKYLGKDDYVGKQRPATAMRLLRMHALRKHGLQGGPNVLEVVGAASKKHKVKPVRLPAVVRTVELEDPRGMLESLQELQPPEVECFITDLDRVEPDVERMKMLANAWSLGDTEKLRSMFRQLTLRDAIREGCVHLSLAGATMWAMYEEGTSADAAHMKKLLEDSLWHVEQATLQAQLDWLKAAQAALAKNKSTFAVLSLAEVLSPDGHLERLRALGYTVEEPR
jgi:hypothetical protein